MNLGDTYGPTKWVAIPQARIDTFADATGDHQWIHVDPQRAASGRFGTTIAHGYLTLSLLAAMAGEALPSDPSRKMGINYGLGRVRFPAPVPVDSRVRGTFRVDALEEHDWGHQVTLAATVECDGGNKPVCVAELIYRFYS